MVELTQKLSRRDLFKLGCAGLLASALSALSPEQAAAPTQLVEPHLRLNFVYGKDNLPSEAELIKYQQTITSAMFEIQSWYASQLDGQTFQFDPVLRLKELPLTVDQIRCDTDFACLSDKSKVAQQAWQKAFWNPRTKSVTLALENNRADIFFLRGGGEQAMGGKMNSQFGGFVVIGDRGLEGLTGIVNRKSATCAESSSPLEWQCTNSSAIAALAHEIGHLAVMHNSHDAQTLMGGNISQGLEQNGFSNTEIPVLKKNNFFQHRFK